MAIEHQPRSIAAEVALLFLNELEPRIDNDPELLVSSEAILALAAIRRGDPARWDHWRAILTRYQKFEVVDYMLCEPKADGAEFSRADLLVRRCLSSGIELFHDSDQHGWASVRVGQHWENYPLRSRAFHLFMLRTYYLDTGESPGSQALRAALEIFEARALFDGPEHAIHLRVAEHGGKLYLDSLRSGVESSRDRYRGLAHRRPCSRQVPSRTRLPAVACSRARREHRGAAAFPQRRPRRLGTHQSVPGRRAQARDALPDPGRQGRAGSGEVHRLQGHYLTDRSSHLRAQGRTARGTRPRRCGAQCVAGLFRQS